MKRKVLLVLMSAVLVLLLVTSGCVGKAAPAPGVTPTEPTYHWKVVVLFAPAECEKLIRPWLDDVEAALGGRAEFELFSAGELMPFEQHLPACQAGTVDFAFICPPVCAIPTETAWLSCYGVLGWNSAMEARVLWDVKGIKELQTEIYEQDIGGVHYLPTETSDPIHLISSRPIERYEDLKGLKISGDATLTYPFEEAGATSVLIPPEDLYLAGTTGMVDAILWCGAKEATTSSWNEPFPYFLTNAVNGGATQEWVVNLDLWNSLPSDMQEILTLSWEALGKRQLVYYYEGECACRKNFTLTTMPEEDWAKIKASAAEKWAEIAQTGPKAAEFIRIVEAYNEEVESQNWWR